MMHREKRSSVLSLSVGRRKKLADWRRRCWSVGKLRPATSSSILQSRRRRRHKASVGRTQPISSSVRVERAARPSNPPRPLRRPVGRASWAPRPPARAQLRDVQRSSPDRPTHATPNAPNLPLVPSNYRV